jgi:endonuclease
MHADVRPPVWRMILEGIDALGGATTNVALKSWVLQRYPGTNPLTIQAQMVVCTVNHTSRVHYQQNHKPRPANGPYDFLFRPEAGRLERYDPARHGQWEIYEQEDGRLGVRPAGEGDRGEGAMPVAPVVDHGEGGSAFAAEAHLRDYLARNLAAIEPGLELYVDEAGSAGVEYRTPVGIIDILAVDRDSGLVVIELKVSKGPDAVAGQVLRYKNWVARHLAEGRKTRGLVVAQHVSDKVRYALLSEADVSVREYELEIRFKDVPPLT